MPVSETQWREVIGDFIPVGPPRPQELRRFFVDRYENDPTESIFVQLRAGLLSRLEQPKPYQALLTGCRGSGKSSELMRLAQEVADKFFVVLFDAETTLNDYSVNQFDVLLGIGLATHKAAQQAGLRPPQKLTENLLKSLAKIVRKYEDRAGFTLNLNQLLKQVTALFIGAGAEASALAATGEKAAREEVIAALLERLSDAEWLVRDAAARALAATGEKAAREEVIVALLERLSDAEDSVRAAAARALGEMGEKAAREEVIAALLKRLSDAEWSVRDAAANALGSLALKVQLQSKPSFINLVLPHARNKRRGYKNYHRREAGYIALRNLMAAGVSDTGEAV